MKAVIRETMMVPKLEDDGSFQWIQVNAGNKYDVISNDCGPVLITLKGIILPKRKVLTE